MTNMNEYLLQSTARPSLFVSNIMPSVYLSTPVRWGSRENAAPLTHNAALNMKAELARNGVDATLIEIKA